MAPPTWKDCFDFAIRLLRYTGHPPFAPRTRLNFFVAWFQYLVDGFLGLRMVVTVVLGERGLFLGLIVIFLVGNAFVRIGQINLCYRDYCSYFAEIDEFLRENEYNPITRRRNHFMEVWAREKPTKLVTVLMVFTMTLSGLWFSGTVFNAVVSEEVPRPLYWSPFFEVNNAIKWFYVLQEILPIFTLTYLPWYLNMTFTAFIKFQYAQLVYLRELAVAVAEDGFHAQKKEVLTWWIKIHQQVLRSAYRVNSLLGLHALSSYFTQIFYAVLAIIVLLFENVTQDVNQKILCLLLSVSQLLEFGYNCMIVESWEEVHNTVRDVLFSENLMKADKWQLSAYRMVTARMNKPLRFTAVHFVTLTAVTFRGMVTNIYSLFTSLMSILSSKAP